MTVKSPSHISGNSSTYAVTSTDAPGLCSVEWQDSGKLTGITCDGYIAADGTLFVPGDGDSARGAALNDDGTLDQACGGWYKAETGDCAIFIYGLPCVLE